MHRVLNLGTGRYESVETAEEARRRTTPRQRFATKADWAKDRAESLSKQAYELERMSSGGSYARAARKAKQVSHLRSEAQRYRDIEQRLRKVNQ